MARFFFRICRSSARPRVASLFMVFGLSGPKSVIFICIFIGFLLNLFGLLYKTSIFFACIVRFARFRSKV